MFYKIKLRDFVTLDPVALQSSDIRGPCMDYLRRNYEGAVLADIGYIIKVLEINNMSSGILVPREGSTQHEVEFTVISFLPEQGEIIEGELTEFTPRLAKISFCGLAANCPVSQITPTGAKPLRKRKLLVARHPFQKDRILKLKTGTRVRVKIISVRISSNINRMLTVSMKLPYLGAFEWFRENPQKKEGDSK